MKMMMMMMMMFLVLSCVSADILHQDLNILGCSSSDGEYMYALDGEEVWFADFIKKKGVDPQPDFVDHVTYPEGAYQQAEGEQQTCRFNLDVCRKAYKDLPLEQDAPSSPMIYPRDNIELGQKNVLICHVTGFYPAPVKIYWTKNGENVTEGTSINVPFPSKDGTFSQSSRLQFLPQQGDIYSCTVGHRALDQPLTRIWDVEKTEPSIGPSVFCGLGLTVGLLGVAAGTFFLVKGNECS
ncbi:H-2 class II histocompatibility antigen, A-U alpha chain-like isoform X1 [Pempheris klunzingeri]|uniref:H-2 class II histocompatibility antigen, A-U alpha chain-like isoform X1 n=1 Tax=Pempheris klunzingeri TaxID=3127111 RepID=UPI003980882D